LKTEPIAQLMKPTEVVAGSKRAPKVVMIDWGTFRFRGMVESYQETIDFFAPVGVPLRSTVKLTLANQDRVFEPEGSGADRFGNTRRNEPVVQSLTASGESATGTPPSTPPPGPSTTQLASQGGNPQAGRAIAAANGQQSMRFPSGPIALSAEIRLSPPVAFASGSIGGGLSAGLGIGGGISGGISGGIGAGVSGGISNGIGAGIGAGVSGGISGGIGGGIGAGVSGGIGAGIGGGISGSAGFSAGAGFSLSGSAGAGLAIGGSASAGISAGAGAFSGLRTASESRFSTQLDTSRFIQRSGSFRYATSGSNTSFQVGGRATIQGSASLTADVGASASLRSRIQFDGT
jgi:Contractile injection system tube protein